MKTSTFFRFVSGSLAIASTYCILASHRSVAAGDEHWDSEFPRSAMCKYVYTLVSNGNLVYAGGRNSGDPTNFNICLWDGSQWTDIGNVSGGVPFVFDFAFVGNNVYIGGVFSQVNGVLASGLARWDGTNWFGVPGIGGAVYSLARDGTNLYVGGSFTNAGEATTRFIARWDGMNWSDLGTGVNSYVSSIIISGSDVYVAGPFTTAGGVTANRIAKWNGSTWSSLGAGDANGVGGSVLALTVNDSDVYVGGTFTTAGGVPANSVAKWNGTSWSALGAGITGQDGEVRALAFSGGKLYAGGTFTNAGGVRALSLAGWDGTNWFSLGSGISAERGIPDVIAMAGSGADLYVSGNFVSAGLKPAPYFSHWNEQMNFDQPSMMQLSNARKSATGRFQFRVTASGAAAYVIEASTDFSFWTPLLTNSISPFDFEDAGPLSGSRFYRTRQQ